MDGRALAFSRAITMASAVINKRSDPKFPIFSATPKSLNFGNVRNGTTKRDSITVKNTGAADLIITSVLASNTLFTITPTTLTIKPDSSVKYFITFAPLIDGIQNGNFIFTHNAEKPKDTITVTGTGVSPIFTSNKYSLDFGKVRNGTTKMDSISVKNTGTADLIISTVVSSNVLYTITPTNLTIRPDSTTKYYITFAPLTDGVKNGNFIFTHNASKPRDTIIVTGTGVSPLFTSNNYSLDFGKVRISTTKMDSISVKNTGTSDLIITTVVSSNALFTITPTNLTIRPDSTTKYYITFAPLNAGIKTGNIIFTHNADKNKDTILLTGEGVEPLFTTNKSSLNFGDVRNGTTKMDSIIVTNTGTSDLIISTVVSSNALYTIMPSNLTIVAGANTKYYITFAPLNDGIKNGTIIFTHNAAKNKDTISLTGRGVEPLFTSNRSSINFGDVRNGTTKRDSITVTNTGTSDLIISTVVSSNALYTITPTNLTIVAGANTKYYITFAPLTDGIKTGNIIFTHNATKNKDTIALTGRGVSPKFSATPMSINFGDVRNGTTKRDSIVVSNPGTSDLIISGIAISNSVYTVSPNNATISAGGSMKYYITFAPLNDGIKNGNIIFTHNADKPKDTIIVTGRGVSPLFSINNNTVDFGDVRNGTTKMDSVTVTNIGTSDLVISNITSSNSLFSINPNNSTITAGQNRKFYITFAPLTDGIKNGTIIFTNNAAKNRDTILLTGRGVSPIFSVSPINLNFGNVLIGTSKKDSVVVTNLGTSVLTINNVTSYNFQYLANPVSSSILPGMSKVFVISFSPQSDGVKTGACFSYHDADNLRDSISMNGVGISPKFVINPRSINFGEVNTALTKRDSIKITNTGTSDLLVYEVFSTDNHFVVTETGASIAPGDTHTFYVLFTPLTAETHSGFIRFKFNAAITTDAIAVTGKGIGDPLAPVFVLNQKNYDLGSIQCGEKTTKTVTITNFGTANLTILGSSSSNVYYSVAPAVAVIAPNTTQDFIITFAPLKGGIQTGKIYFYHNASNTIDSINVTGLGLGDCIGPIFTIKTILDFGNVNIGESKQKSVIVVNTGSSDLIINKILSNDNQYTVVPIITTIAPGAEKEIFITFTPNKPGQSDAEITFSHNAGEDKVLVTGVGIKILSVITIDAAKKLPVGTEFLVEGIITRTLGDFTRFQDDTAGLTILQTSGEFYDAVTNLSINMGDRVSIQGKITEVNQLKVIQGSGLVQYKILSRNNSAPTPINVTLLEIKNNGEVHESRLIKLVDLTITNVGDVTFKENKNYQVIDNSDNSNSVIIRIGSTENSYMSGRPFFGEKMKFEGILGQVSDINPNMGYELTPILTTDLMTFTTGIEYEELVTITNLENYPNPFAISTSIQYNLEKSAKVNMTIIDINGNEITTLVNENQEAGTHTVVFNLSDQITNIPNGTYFNKLEIDGKTIISKMQIIK